MLVLLKSILNYNNINKSLVYLFASRRLKYKLKNVNVRKCVRYKRDCLMPNNFIRFKQTITTNANGVTQLGGASPLNNDLMTS